MRVGRLAVAELSETIDLMRGSSVKSADLMAFVNPQLTSYKRPSKIIVLDALPATSTGKILKHKLAQSLHGA
jgi:long-chain acyl-CoA synthetase